ncbi:hypothetical protein DERP_006836 [Dermatophagoides pteronyssinus]|uniref:Uncharacterized protein n=1 Tax=Dermatophagoides pteronyssinus TaxID=6956 RepID=A0ABQ8IS50_DERPT|nr:hypothetical protein DERP_006836 [Dermatophagoides pteronyssinus]
MKLRKEIEHKIHFAFNSITSATIASYSRSLKKLLNFNTNSNILLPIISVVSSSSSFLFELTMIGFSFNFNDKLVPAVGGSC